MILICGYLFQKRAASPDQTFDEEDEDEMIMRLEKEKEERRNRRKRAKIEVNEKEETDDKPPEDEEQESRKSPSEIYCATMEAETPAAGAECLKSSNHVDSNANNEPKEHVEAAEISSESSRKPKDVERKSTEDKDSSNGAEKTEDEDYDVERIVDYSWCRETVSDFCSNT